MWGVFRDKGPRTGFRFVGHLRSERRELLIEYASETALACKPTGADVWSLKEAEIGDSSVLEAQRCIDWDGGAKKPKKNVRVELGADGKRFELGAVIAALGALAAREGGFSKLGLESVTWVAADDALGLPDTSTIRLAATATDQGTQQLLSAAERFQLEPAQPAALPQPRGGAKRQKGSAAFMPDPHGHASLDDVMWPSADPQQQNKRQRQGALSAAAAADSCDPEQLRSALAEAEERIARLERKLQAAEDKAKVVGAEQAAAAIKEGFPRRVAFLLQGLPPEQQQHAPPIMELCTKALNKLVALYE